MQEEEEREEVVMEGEGWEVVGRVAVGRVEEEREVEAREV